ncbi:MAG: T9SS type A sorting domain-containing protein [Bacteroidetes bacterium]|nr:T9SS type A sorting domain-containing protein [Bacteroidota bacterium]
MNTKQSIKLILFFCAFLGTNIINAQPQYYNYNTTGTGNSYPFNIPVGKKVQLLYLAGDFNKPSSAPAGNIISISFMLYSNLGPYTYADFIIKMGQSSITGLPDVGWYTGELDTVYKKTSVSLSGTAGQWMTITLDSGFIYDPAKSLIVEVEQCGATGATGFACANTTLTGNRRNWSAGGCPYVWQSKNSSLTNFGFSLSNSWTGSISTDWSVAGNWDPPLVPTDNDNIYISSIPTNQPHVTAASDSPALCKTLSIGSGANITIDAGKALTASGNITNSGTFTIKSDASSIGSLLNTGSITGTGDFKVERWVKTNGSSRWEYVSSPVASASSSIFTSASNNLYYADETQNAWFSYTNDSPQNMSVLKGYARKYIDGQGDGDVAKTITGGTLNTGSLSIGLTRTGTAPGGQHGWNLVGNPYPSAIDWDATSGWTKTHLDGAYYVRSNGNYGAYTTDGIGTVSATRYIPPMQAFWVRVSSGETTGTLECTNDVRVHNSHNIYKTKSLNNILHLTVSNNANSLTDDTYIRFKEEATEGFDVQYDAYKMFAAEVTYPQIYTNNGNDDISINSLNELTGERTIPLGFKTTISGQFTIIADMVESFTGNGNTVYIEDRQNGIFQDLSLNNTYEFYSDATAGLTRLFLHFNLSTTNIIEDLKSDIQIYSYKNVIHLKSFKMLEGDVSVYDILGQIVAARHLSGSSSGVISMDSQNAIYIVKYTTKENTITKRIFINQ